MVEENGHLIDYDVLCSAHLVSTDHIVYGYRAYLPITKKLVGLLDRTKILYGISKLNQYKNSIRMVIVMKLNEIVDKSLQDILGQCDVMNVQYFTNDDGEVQAIQIKYTPKDRPAGIKPPPNFVGHH